MKFWIRSTRLNWGWIPNRSTSPVRVEIHDQVRLLVRRRISVARLVTTVERRSRPWR